MLQNTLTVLALVIAATGCREYDYDAGGSGGDYGAITGGAQDMAYARDVIAQGGVPAETDFPVEGLIAEHDIPVDGAPCADLLCARPSIGRAPDLATGTDATWIQLGMSSGMPAPYVRPPIDLVIVIDRSSTMAIDLNEVQTAVDDAIAQMGPDDRLGIVAFNGHTDVLHTLSRVDDASALERRVGQLNASGMFDVAPAIDTAYSLFDHTPYDGTRLRRVMLFTCSYALGSSLQNAVEDGADAHIGTSVYGVLLGWDSATADLLGGVHGGSFHYMESLEAVHDVFVDDFDFAVSPIAYDLQFGLQLDDAWAVQQTYGVPGDAQLSSMIDVNTAFLSQGHGAVFVRVEPQGSGDGITPASRVGSVTLDYTPEPAHGFPDAAEESVPLALPPDGEPASDGIVKGAALVNEAEQLGLACGEYQNGQPDLAITRLEALSTYLSDVRDSLGDAALDPEVALVNKLIDNMR